MIYGSDVTGMPPAQLNEAWLIAREICPEKTYHRCLDLDLMLEDAAAVPGRRGVPLAILMWMTKTLLVASDTLRDCINPWKLVNGLASAVVASMMRFGWQVLSGMEFGTHKGVLSFASVGDGELHAVVQDSYDRWTWERACNRILVLALVGGPHLTAPLKLAVQHLRTPGEHLARGAVQSVFLGTMRTQNLK